MNNSTALILSGFALAACASGQTVLFDFDTATPLPVVGQNLPFDQAAGGMTAHFSSPSGPAFSIQSDSSTGFRLSQFSGNYLYDNNLNRNALDIRFSLPVASISLKFATADFHQNETPTTLQLTAFLDSTGAAIGSSTAHGSYGNDTMPMGTLTFQSGGRPFNLVEIVVPAGQALASSDFFVDNVLVTPAGGPSAVAVSPASGSGAGASMTFVFDDPRGWGHLDVVNILINNQLDGRKACYLAYTLADNVLYLVDDAGGGLLPGLALNGSGSVSNSQCTVSAQGSSAAGSGITLTLALNVTFTAAFAGRKIAYLAARDVDSGNSGWQALGTWTAPGAPVTPVSVSSIDPVRGAGAAGRFTVTFNDTNGYRDLGVVNLLINDFLDGNRACYLAYSAPLNTLYLVNDTGTAISGIPVNGSGGIGNSQCSVDGANTTAAVNGNTLTLTVALNFSPAFAGNRIVYAAARDIRETGNSGWQAMGTWTAP